MTRGGGGGGVGGAIRPPNLPTCVNTKIKKPPMDIVENRKPKLTQVSFQVVEKSSSDGATNKQCLIDDQKDTKTTITKLSTASQPSDLCKDEN